MLGLTYIQYMYLYITYNEYWILSDMDAGGISGPQNSMIHQQIHLTSITSPTVHHSRHHSMIPFQYHKSVSSLVPFMSIVLKYHRSAAMACDGCAHAVKAYPFRRSQPSLSICSYVTTNYTNYTTPRRTRVWEPSKVIQQSVRETNRWSQEGGAEYSCGVFQLFKGNSVNNVQQVNQNTRPQHAMWKAALGRWTRKTLGLSNMQSKVKPLTLQSNGGVQPPILDMTMCDHGLS